MSFKLFRLLTTRRVAITTTTCARAQSSLSTVHRGIAFEEKALAALRGLSMALRRVGGRSDGGVDLQGWWWIPVDTLDDSSGMRTHSRNRAVTLSLDHTGRERTRIRVLVQCKAEKKKLGPSYVREMEGVLHRFLASPSIHDSPFDAADPDPLGASERHPAVAILVSSSEFTKAAAETAMSSSLPLCLVHIPPGSSSSCSEHGSLLAAPTEEVGSVFWNPALGGTKGLFRGRMDIRWERGFIRNQEGSELLSERPVLWYAGERLQSWIQPFPLP